MFEFNLKEENVRYSILTYVSTIQVYEPLGSASKGHLAAQSSFLTVKDVALSSNLSGPLPHSIWWSTGTMWGGVPFFFFGEEENPRQNLSILKCSAFTHVTIRTEAILTILPCNWLRRIMWPFALWRTRGSRIEELARLLLGNHYLASTLTTAVVFLYHCSSTAVHIHANSPG